MTQVDVNSFFEELKNDEIVLMHYGTKGMKWGVRKADRPNPGHLPSGGTFVKARRRTAPQLGDHGDVQGVKNKAKSFLAASAGSLAVDAAKFGSIATIIATNTVGTVPTLSGPLAPIVTNGAANAILGISLGASVLAWPAAMATKAYLAPLSTAYHTSKSDIRRGVRSLNTQFKQPGHDLRTNKKLQSEYNKSYQKIVEDAMNKSKSGYSHPFRKIAETRTGKTSTNEYKIKFHMDPKGVKKPTMTLEGPDRFMNEVKLGSFRHSAVKSDDFNPDRVIAFWPFELIRDEDGFIEDFTIDGFDELDTALAHDAMNSTITIDEAKEFLAHSNIKGVTRTS